MYAGQIFAERQLKLSTPEEVAAHIVCIPSVLPSRIILMDQMTEHKSDLFMGVSKNKGGLIV